jgi:hypothetical protein
VANSISTQVSHLKKTAPGVLGFHVISVIAKRLKCRSRVIFQPTSALTMAHMQHQLGGGVGAFLSLSRIKANGPANKNKHTHTSACALAV